MRASQSASLICKHVGRVRPNLVGSCRTASSRARPGDTFDASKLVLDLDAADSKYVRPYDASRDRQRFRQSSKPVNIELPVSEETDKLYVAKLDQLFPGPDIIYSATGADYLALSMWNDFLNIPIGSRSLAAVLSRNQVPKSWYLYSLERQIAPTIDLLSHAPLNSIETNQESVFDVTLDTIRHCDKMPVLRRATGLLTQSVEGCRFLVKNAAVLATAIRECRGQRQNETPTVHVGVVLEYIANLTTNMEAKGVEIGPIICDLGISYASQSAIFSAIKRYIDLAVSRQYPEGEKGPHRVENHRLVALRTFAYERPSRRALDIYKTHWVQMEAVLKLLTGWNVAGMPSDGEERQPSFSNFAGDNADMYREYMITLGRLGATEALWGEWSAPDMTPAPPTMNETDKITIFMDAMTAARARSTATTALRGVEVNNSDRSQVDDEHLRKLEDSIYRLLPGKLGIEWQPLQEAVDDVLGVDR